MVSKRGRIEQRLQLFKIENPPDPKTIAAIAVASILSSKDRLARMVEALSKHLDAVSQTIDALGDTDPRIQIVHATKLVRKRFTKAMLELSQAAKKLPAMQQDWQTRLLIVLVRLHIRTSRKWLRTDSKRPELVSISVIKFGRHSPKFAHRVISLRFRIWPLSGAWRTSPT
jgi:hypothetical protein